MLSRGRFLDLYIYGYDSPEGYAIEKDGKMYYAFYTPERNKPWKGLVELRGLAPGKYNVVNYENADQMRSVEATSPKLDVEFTNHLLLEVSRAAE
jgi:alpha-galactosidase